MRTIKFRGKRIDNGMWIYGDLMLHQDGDVYIGDNTRYWTDDGYHNNDYEEVRAVDDETVGQFTGLKDAKGNEIYEDDIITVNGRYPRVVLWDKTMWALMPTEYYHDAYFWVMNLQHPGQDWWEEFSDAFEIIGNIHNDPELLKEK